MHDPSMDRDFHTTHWSMVLAAGAGAGAALEELCRAYWYPLYAFVRYRDHPAEEARDLTQAFFARILEKRGLSTADPDRGRFRSYLLGAMKHFLANEWDRARTQKRGGGAVLLSWDALEPEARYAMEPACVEDPGAAFDRAWARETIGRAHTRLSEEMAAAGKEKLFEVLGGCLGGAGPDRARAAEQLGMSRDAVKVAVHRLRRRYGEILRAEIADTVTDPADLEDEMRHLVAALREKTENDL